MADTDKLRLHFKRGPKWLSPIGPYEEERLDQYAIGDTLEVTIWKRRSPRNHSHFFAFMGALVKAGAVPFDNTDAFLDALKVALHWTTPILDLRGQVVGMRPRSISWTAAEEPEFQAFKQSAMALIARHYGVTPEDI